MEKKRLVGIVFLLFGAILSIAVIAEKYPSLEKDSKLIFEDDNFINYTYAIGMGKDDDTSKAGCLEGEDASAYPETIQIYQKMDGNNVILDVYGQGGDLYDNQHICWGECPFSTCKWKLPASSPKTGGGCYFLANEHDAGLGTAYSNAPDDCAGWIMPVETTLPSITQTTPKASGKEILEASGGSFTEDSFSKYFTEEGNLLRGEFDLTGDGPSSSDAACMMSKLFPSNTKSFLCMNATTKEEFVWYICDSANTGKFIKSNDGMNAFFCEAGPPLKWVKKPLDCDSEGIDCDKEAGKEICTSKYGTLLNDIETPGSAWNEQAGCCGDDGLGDLGKISEDGTYLCSHEETLGTVSTPPEDSNSFTEDNIKDLSPEGWRWVVASDGNFKIRDLGSANRILSNNHKWFKCNATNKGPLKENTAGTPLEQTDSRRFYCVGEGDHGWWKECLIEGTPEEGQIGNPPLTQVGTGDNLYTLYLPESKLIPKEGTSEKDLNTKFSKSAYPSESGETVLLYKWIGNPYSVLIQNAVEPKVKVVASGKNFDLDDANLLDYANVPYLKENGIIETVLPGIASPDIYSSIPVSFLKVFQRTSAENEGPFCSGKTSGEPGISSWIKTLDDETGQLACEANGYTWTGKQCCEVGDYYLDGTVTLSDKEEQILTPTGCWNGITLEEGDSIGEIKFTISAGDKTLDELYPCKKETGKECRYFIKGIIEEGNAIEDVTLTNLFPEKYDLVARAFNEFEPGIKKEVLITANGVKINRNKYYLEAKNVPAMAIVGKNKEGQGIFLSCGQELTKVSNTEAVPLCTIYQDNYCSAQGWTSKAPAKFNFNPETKEYEPTGEAYEPDVLFDHSGSIVFGRNLIPNAPWEMTDKKIKDWYQGPLVSVLSSENNKLTITGTDSIKSPFFYFEEKIYSLSFNSDCKVDNTLFVSVINKKGEKIKLSLSQQTGNQYSFSFSPSAEEYQIELMPVGMCNIANLSLYLLPPTFSEVPFNYDALHQPITAQQCCPENTCWNGFTCAEDMSLQTEREETVADGVSYRCLKGNWTAQEKKWDWAHKVQGYCEKETQCFVAPITPLSSEMQGATAGVAAEEFYKETTPSCINDTEFIFDHYCQDGEWTTRTKFLITALQNLAQNNSYQKYLIYCSPYKETLNDYGSAVYDVEQFIGGSEDYTKLVSDPGCQFKKDDPACQTTGKLCFSGANSNLVPNEENTCVNNFCLLTHEEDKQQKTIFAVSLNQPIDDASNSFLYSLGIEIPEEIQSACPMEGNDWVDCEIKMENAFLKYHPQLKMVAYSSQKFDFAPSTLVKVWSGIKKTIDEAIDFIGGWFGMKVEKIEPGQLPKPLAESMEKQIPNAFTLCPAQDTSRYFFFFGSGKSAKACVWNNTLSASYYNFVTPVCDFADHTLEEKKKITQEETTEPMPPQGQSAYFCDDDIPKVTHLKITNPHNFAFWWPQLTGRLRIN